MRFLRNDKLNAKPLTRNSKPETRNPKPETKWNSTTT